MVVKEFITREDVFQALKSVQAEGSSGIDPLASHGKLRGRADRLWAKLASPDGIYIRNAS